MLLVGISPNRFTPTAYPGEPLFHVTVPQGFGISAAEMGC